MNKQQQTEHFEQFTSRMRQTLLSKGDDYAGEENRLANFENTASITGISPELSCLNLIAVKVARLGVLLNSPTTPKSEASPA